MVQQIRSEQEFVQLLASPLLVVVDFTASWCGPCKAIAPVFEQLSQKYGQSAKFAKVDVDELQSVAASAGVTAMPTFQFFKSGKRVDELRGANAKGLEDLIKKHMAAAASTEAAVADNYGIAGQMNLIDQIDQKQAECLNEKRPQSVRDVFSKNGGKLESDCDEQLMISVPFLQKVRIHSVKLEAVSKEMAPKTIRLFVNRPHLGFDEVDSVEPTQVLELTEADFDDKAVINLRFVKFQNVSSLSIFVENNLGGGEETALKRIVFIGSLLEQTKDLTELKKAEEQQH